MKRGYEFHNFVITSWDQDLLFLMAATARKEWKLFSKKPLTIVNGFINDEPSISFTISDYSFPEFYSALRKELPGYEILRKISVGYSGTVRAIIRRHVSGPFTDSSQTYKALVIEK